MIYAAATPYIGYRETGSTTINSSAKLYPTINGWNVLRGGALVSFTIGATTGLITYTGAPTRTIRFNVSFSFKPNSVTPFTTNWYLGENGGTSSAADMGSLTYQTVAGDNSVAMPMAFSDVVTMATNDTVALWCAPGSGTVNGFLTELTIIGTCLPN